MLTAPLYVQDQWVDPSAASYPANVLLNVALRGPGSPPFMVLYPILPWIGCFGLGWCLGRLYERGHATHGGWITSAGVVLVTVAFCLRWFTGSYGDRLPTGAGPSSAIFWAMSKYPPSPVFLLSTIGIMAVMVGLLRLLDGGERLGVAWKVPIVYGRVALFFYVVHVYLYGIYPFVTGTQHKYSLGLTYAVWLAGLIVLYVPCVWYHRLRSRYRAVLRYF